MSKIITLAHGSGGKLTYELINDIFLKHFSNDFLLQGDDSARLELPEGRIAYTTDSFVVSPVFFKGGDIGKLSICGTVNDLASSGARPLYLSCGFIIEEGLTFEELERIAVSMADTALECGVKIVTGDTKVVQKGAADKVFINTSGIGIIPKDINITGRGARPGDKVIVTGPIGDHGCSILLEREGLNLSTEINSDCAPLNGLVQELMDSGSEVHVLRDPTRGGIAATLNEIAKQSGAGIKLYEDAIPVRDEVRGLCEMLGLDPMYVANEGKMLVILPGDDVKIALEALKSNKYGMHATVIGEVVIEHPGMVSIRTVTGGSRIVDMPVGEQLPRIC